MRLLRIGRSSIPHQIFSASILSYSRWALTNRMIGLLRTRYPKFLNSLRRIPQNTSKFGKAKPSFGLGENTRLSYCTFPVTDALPSILKVQVLALLAPLEHAPDQTASRPLLTLKVIVLLIAKPAD